MITLKNGNFAQSMIAAPLTAQATSVQVTAGTGGRFPASGPFCAVLWDGVYQAPHHDVYAEIVIMQKTGTDTFSITRGQEGTTARAWYLGTRIAHVLTAAKLNELEQEIAQAMLPQVLQVSADTNCTAARSQLICVNSTGGARTITLPLVAGSAGYRYMIKRVDASANSVTLRPHTSDTGIQIDGSSTLVLSTAYSAVTVISDGVRWNILHRVV